MYEKKDLKTMLYKQLALDYCCTAEEVADPYSHFTEYHELEGRRRFEEQDTCALKVAVVNGKLLFTGKKEIVKACREKYETHSHGYRLKTAHPFFLPGGKAKEYECDVTIRRYQKAEIKQFEGDARFDEAFCFDEKSPDMLGVAAVQEEEIIGMAGASADSLYFWQIGINVAKEAEGRHIATKLVSLITQDILEQGKVPYYGTSMSNLASQRVAANTGFEVAWVELLAERE